MLVGMAVTAPTRTVATTAAPGPADAGRHGVVVLDKIRPGQSSSRVLSRTCADRADAPAPTTLEDL
jgi:hypothetical protein